MKTIITSRRDFLRGKAKLIAGIGSSNEWGFKETKTFDASWRELRSEKDIISFDKRFARSRGRQISSSSACGLQDRGRSLTKNGTTYNEHNENDFDYGRMCGSAMRWLCIALKTARNSS